MEKKVTTEVSDNIFLMHLPAVLFLTVCSGLMVFSAMSTSADKREGDNQKSAHTSQYQYISPSKFVPKPKEVPLKFSSADITTGKKLFFAHAMCKACHNEEVKMVGPALKDIAKKYKLTNKDIATLMMKVTKGGTGTWGAAAMPPNPGIKKEELKKMIAYILSLK